jgi:hypothetical protein
VSIKATTIGGASVFVGLTGGAGYIGSHNSERSCSFRIPTHGLQQPGDDTIVGSPQRSPDMGDNPSSPTSGERR